MLHPLKQYVVLKVFTENKSINKHNQKLIIILENQKIYDGFLEMLILQVSLSRTHLQSKTFLFYIQS